MRKIFFLTVLTMSLFLFTPTIRADFITISHQAFTPSEWDDDYNRVNYLHKPSSNGWMQAPVYLPEGAIIDSIWLYYWDNNTGAIRVYLQRTNSFTGGTQIIFGLQTPGEHAGLRVAWDNTAAGTLRLVRNGVCSYFVNIAFDGFGTDYRVYSVRIQYH